MTKSLFLENLLLKAAAVVLALALWLIVTARGQTETALNIPIEYTNIPSGIEIARHAAKTANIVIRGNESMLKNIRRGDVRAIVDAGDAKQGENTFQIRKDDINLPYAVTITRIDPLSVKIVFEETVSKKVIIKPEITGSPESGYYVKSFKVEPKDMVVEGTKSEVRKVSYIKTEPIDISGLTEDLNLEAGLDMSGKNIRTKVERVDVQVRIGRKGK